MAINVIAPSLAKKAEGLTAFALIEEVERINVVMSYTSPLVQKLHPCSGVTSKTYKSAFYSSYLFHNISHGSATTI